MATVIAAHDLSGVGRCSLTAALSVLPALGHTCYPLPTAVLSQQTGFSGYSFLDLTSHIPDFLAGWHKLELKPDMIYTGFLGCGKQAGILEEFIDENPGALVVVDPVMGDEGRIYGCYDADFVKDMLRLVRKANVILPNATEFNLLTGAQSLPDDDGLIAAARGLDAPGLDYVVVTGASRPRGMRNLLIDLRHGDVFEVAYCYNGISYSGSGDLFASAVCGFMLLGLSVYAAVKAASDFVSDAAFHTPAGSDSRFGLYYEPLLRQIHSYAAI